MQMCAQVFAVWIVILCTDDWLTQAHLTHLGCPRLTYLCLFAVGRSSPMVARVVALIGLFGVMGIACGGSSRHVDGGGQDASTATDGGASDGAVGYSSGTRIKAQVLVTDDGFETFVGWFDTKYGVACVFETADDDAERCLPDVPTEPPTFIDAQCTIPALYIAPDMCHPVPSMVGATSDSGCRRKISMFTVGSTIAGATIYYQKPIGGTCTQHMVAGGQLHALGPIAAGNFVSANEGPGDSSGRIAPWTLHAADGAQALGGFFDKTENLQCASQTSEDRSLRCLPVPGALILQTPYYADAACTHQAAFGSTTLCGSSSPFVLEYPPDGCDQGWKVFGRGAAISSSVAYAQLGGVCSKLPSLMSGDQLFDIGEPMPPSSFALLQSVELGSARLHAVALAADDGVSWTTGAIVDSMLSTPCHFGIAADGQERCLPEGLSFPFYADPECSDPLGVNEPVNGCLTPARYALTLDATGCMLKRHVFTLGATVAASQVYLKAGSTTCLPAMLSMGSVVYRLGAEIAPGMLQSGRIVTR
jgi:hypothetical protein